jgi:hypothetical protein
MAGPEKEFRAGGVSATVWNNQQMINGNKMDVKSVQIQRNYLDDKKEWKKTSSFKTNDLPKLVAVATEAFKYLTLKEREPNNMQQIED